MNDMKPTLDEQARLLSRAFAGRIESRELPDGTYQHTAKAERMEWTDEYPTQPGYYRIRNYYRRWTNGAIILGPDLVEIIDCPIVRDGSLDVRWQNEKYSYPIDNILAGEFYGPIEPPE